MKLTVLPVSGGAFPSQLAELSILGKHRGILLASSGGNISAYIAMAADYNPAAIERILRCLNSNMMMSSWWPKPLEWMPSYIPGYARGSYYGPGSGVSSLFHSIFTPKTIHQQEIWTGTTNCKNSQCQLFCNRKKEDVKIKMKYFRREEYNTLTPKYMNGDLDMCAQVSLASASIPGLVPPVKIGDYTYADGGSTYSSPLTPMIPVLRHYRTLHIDYVNSFDVEAKGELCLNTMSTLIRTVTSEMIHSMILNDRATGIQLIRSCDGKLRRVDFCCCPIFLECVEDFRKRCTRSMLEIFPCEYRKVELEKYSCDKAIEIFHLDRTNFKCRFWYISDEDFETIYNSRFGRCREKDQCACYYTESSLN